MHQSAIHTELAPYHPNSIDGDKPLGEVLSHPAPTALAPLPRLVVREVNGMIEVFAPGEPT
jgi:hypothetical protein